jgi:hypothetical protein
LSAMPCQYCPALSARHDLLFQISDRSDCLRYRNPIESSVTPILGDPVTPILRRRHFTAQHRLQHGTYLSIPRHPTPWIALEKTRITTIFPNWLMVSGSAPLNYASDVGGVGLRQRRAHGHHLSDIRAAEVSGGQCTSQCI